VPFYRNLEITDVLLCKFPVVDKNLIRKNLKSFRSDTYTDKKTFKVTTSGSTGTPFTLLHDAEKRKATPQRFFFGKQLGTAGEPDFTT
jgi:phenylacetate-CoA ligase